MASEDPFHRYGRLSEALWHWHCARDVGLMVARVTASSNFQADDLVRHFTLSWCIMLG